MRTVLSVCLLLSFGLAWSQDQSPILPNAIAQDAGSYPEKEKEADDDKQPLPASASVVPADAAVLTIKGLCPETTTHAAPGATDAACQTVITRTQFERLANAIHPNMPPTTKRQLGNSYPKMLAMAREAEKRGLDKQAHFEELIAFARLQILSQELVHQIQEEAAKVPATDVESYYRSNSVAFERVNLERIIVPDIRQNQGGPEAAGSANERRSEQQEKDKEAMGREAETLRARAAAGEDFTKLQKDAYVAAGLTTPPPPVGMSKVRRMSLPSGQQSVFDLKAGEVSAVISDEGGFYIYKLVGKETEPLTEVETEIRKTLESQRMRAMMEKVQNSVATDVNQAYFGVAGPLPRRSKGSQKGAAAVPPAASNPKQ